MSEQFNPRTVAALMHLELDHLFSKWEAAQPLRVGAPHASAILANESDWCLRKYVLLQLHSEAAVHPEAKPWDMDAIRRFLNGWVIHEKYQRLFRKFGKVVMGVDLSGNPAPELDLTHFDETRQVYFSPDAITEFAGHKLIWEIKGYKQEVWEKLDERGKPPLDAHRQVQLYMHLLEIQRGIILVENKNTQQLKVWCVERNTEMIEPYIERMYKVKGATTLARVGKPLPARKCSSCSDRLAEKCPVKALCFKTTEI